MHEFMQFNPHDTETCFLAKIGVDDSIATLIGKSTAGLHSLSTHSSRE